MRQLSHRQAKQAQRAARRVERQAAQRMKGVMQRSRETGRLTKAAEPGLDGLSLAEVGAGEHRLSALPKPGRNAPCPCGSGLKAKRCCGEAGRGLVPMRPAT